MASKTELQLLPEICSEATQYFEVTAQLILLWADDNLSLSSQHKLYFSEVNSVFHIFLTCFDVVYVISNQNFEMICMQGCRKAIRSVAANGCYI